MEDKKHQSQKKSLTINNINQLSNFHQEFKAVLSYPNADKFASLKNIENQNEKNFEINSDENKKNMNCKNANMEDNIFRKLQIFNKLNQSKQHDLRPSHEEVNFFQLRINNFEKFIKEIKSGMAKCKYRKILDDINSREEIFVDFDFFWKIREYKIKCLLKILDRKIFKSDSPLSQKIKSIENKISIIENEISSWIQSIQDLDFSQTDDLLEDQLDTLLHIILEEMYLHARYKFSQKIFPETILILAVGEKIIKYYSDFNKSVKFSQSAQKIYLFISSFLISDNDYITARSYQNLTIKQAYKELFLRVDIEDGIFYEYISKTNQHNLNKIFLNIVQAYYQRGVCDENLGEIPKAIDSYKQAAWFCNNFIKYQYPEISQYIIDVELRSKNYHNLIKKIFEKVDSVEYNKILKNKKKLIEIEQNANKDIISKGAVLESLIKSPKNFEELKNYLDSIKYQEFEFFEDDNKSDIIKMIMSTVNLLNNFSSEKFRDILKELPNLDIENLDKGLVDKIQKRLNDIRAEKKFSDIKKHRTQIKNKNRIIETNNLKIELENYLNKDQKTDPNNANLFNLNNLNFDKNYKISSNMFLSTEKFLSDKNTEATSPINDRRKLNMNMNALTSNNTNSDRKNSKSNGKDTLGIRHRPQSYRIKRDPSKKIEKYYHDEHIFSVGYQNKIRDVKELMKKEIDFQKKLLRLKRYERLPLELKEIDYNHIKDEARTFFERAKSTYKSGFTFSNENKQKKPNMIDIEKNRKEKQKQKLELALIKSLDTRVYSILDNIKKVEEKSNLIRDEFFESGKNIKNQKLDIEKTNSEYCKKIEKDLFLLDKRQSICKKIIERDEKKSNLEKNKRGIIVGNNKLSDIINFPIYKNTVPNINSTYNKYNRSNTNLFPMSTRNTMQDHTELKFGVKNPDVNEINSFIPKNKKIDIEKFIKFEGNDINQINQINSIDLPLDTLI